MVRDPEREFPVDRIGDRIEYRRSAILPPLDFGLTREGNAIRPFVIERGRFIETSAVSGATKYVLYWVAEAIASTHDGREAALQRSEGLGAIARTFARGQKLNGTLLADARFATGYFLCLAQDDTGARADEILITSLQTGSILDSGIPGNVTDLQISESGSAHQDTVLSSLSLTYVAPRPKRSFAGIVPAIDDYPNLGDRTFFGRLDYSGVSGGAGGGLLRIPQARRTGPGTITIAGGSPTIVTGTATLLTQIAKADDQIEIFGRRYRILSVDTNLQITLSAAYPATAPAVTALEEWAIIGKCRVYAVAVSQTSLFVLDSSTPYKDVDLDGELSAPNAPAALTLVRFGNGIRGQFVQVADENVKKYIVKRSTGASDTPTSAEEIIPPIPHDPTSAAADTVLQFEDSNFSVYEREQGQVVRYYVWTVNKRDDISATYATASENCRLDAPSDNSPPNTAREIALNNLWNGHCNGTPGTVVASASVAQDVNMGGAPGAGRHRWNGYALGAAQTPSHDSQTEILLAVDVAGAGTSVLEQDIDGWDHPTPANRRLPTNKLLVLQGKVRSSGGTPNGTLYFDIEQYDAGGSLSGNCAYRQRLSDDTLDTSAIWLAVDGSDIGNDQQLIWGVFIPEVDASTHHFKVRIYYQCFSSNGINIDITEIDLSPGEALSQYTPQMPDDAITYTRTSGGTPAPWNGFDPDDGEGRPIISLQP